MPTPPGPIPTDAHPWSPDLSVVVPAFNEAGRLAEGMARFRDAVRDGAVDLDRTEVIVVDDGSADGTALKAQALLANLPHHQVLRLPHNQGKGAAVRAGVAQARGTYTAYMDADMAIDPRAIPDLADRLGAADVAIGSRALAESMVESRYVVRSLMGRLFNRLVTAGTELPFLDTQCGFKAFRTPVARLLFHLVRIERFAFDVEILARADRLGLRIAEVPVQWKHVAGSSIQPLRDSLMMLADVYRSRLGLLPIPPVPALRIGPPAPASAAGTGEAPASPPASSPGRRAKEVLAEITGGIPFPVLDHGGAEGAVALLALCTPAEAARLGRDLRARLDDLTVSPTTLTPADVAALGGPPGLAGKLAPPLGGDQ